MWPPPLQPPTPPASSSSPRVPTRTDVDSQRWAAVIVASSAGVLLLGFTCFVAALARRCYLRRREGLNHIHVSQNAHPDDEDDDEEAAAFLGVQPNPPTVAWSEETSSSLSWSSTWGERKNDTDAQLSLERMNLYEQFQAVQRHPPYDSRGRVEAEVVAVAQDMVGAVVSANAAVPSSTIRQLSSLLNSTSSPGLPGSPGVTLQGSHVHQQNIHLPSPLSFLQHPHALPSPPQQEQEQEQEQHQQQQQQQHTAPSHPMVRRTEPLALPEPAEGGDMVDAVTLVRARSEAHRKQLEGLRAIKKKLIERTKQIFGDEQVQELSTVERAVNKFLRANTQQYAGSLLPAPSHQPASPPVTPVTHGTAPGEERGRRGVGISNRRGDVRGDEQQCFDTLGAEAAEMRGGAARRDRHASTTSLTPVEEAEVDAVLDGMVAGIVKERITALLETRQQRDGRTATREKHRTVTAASGSGLRSGSWSGSGSGGSGSKFCLTKAVVGAVTDGGARGEKVDTTLFTACIEPAAEATLTARGALDLSCTKLMLPLCDDDIGDDWAGERLETVVLRGAAERDEQKNNEADDNVVNDDDRGVGCGDEAEGDQEGRRVRLWPAAAALGTTPTRPSPSPSLSPSTSSPGNVVSKTNLTDEEIAGMLASLPSSEAAGRPRRAMKRTKKFKTGSKIVEQLPNG